MKTLVACASLSLLAACSSTVVGQPSQTSRDGDSTPSQTGDSPSSPAGPDNDTPIPSTVDTNDPYYKFVTTAPEFAATPHDQTMLTANWNTWVFMPWRYQWDIGTTDVGGQFCVDNGINGGFADRSDGPYDWLQKWNLKFYNDHTSDKGYLHLSDDASIFKPYMTDGRALRTGKSGEPELLNDALYNTCNGFLTTNIGIIESTPQRVAYALDDETSWGSFVSPLSWRVNDDDAAYTTWLSTYYGAGKAPAPQYLTPDSIGPQLGGTIASLDFSPYFDRMTYNDGVWASFLGRLILRANALDPQTPTGVVGAQNPSIFGGYDYAKLMRKLQYIEAYDLGSSQSIIRSLNPNNAMPVVMTQFHSDTAGVAADIWEAWYYFAHGNRGIIAWVENWFTGSGDTAVPAPWIAQLAPTLRELGATQGPKLVGATWIHDGVAIYYSHASIQTSYAFDIEPHGSTWVNRNSDDRLGTSHNVEKAWENILTDAGLQYNYVSYADVIASGVPSEYKVLILPAVYALSDVEVTRFRDFVNAGGVVIADFATGIVDQHGKGRSAGAADDLFGISQPGTLTKADFFGGTLWVETNQDAGFGYTLYSDLFATVTCTMLGDYAIAEPHLAVAGATPAGASANTSLSKKTGSGHAVFLNLSPQRYLQYRQVGSADAGKRGPFIAPITAAGVAPWVTVTDSATGARPRNAEVTYFAKGGRTYVLVVQNVPIGGGSAGGGAAVGLADDTISVDITFNSTAHDVHDERSGAALGDGTHFTASFAEAEAVFFSLAGDPAR